ncbi:ATP-binding cassette domain-containing protein [Cetobacterium sp. 8H]|uniref:ABC transporter ATP-binding protein n=1 Tax=Cetobacterium sp. 8H TaxID=2759681 RepID=UPI00163D09D7|nr:ATP-binding cassette domain-containing protein [Cetobacterium sp. 8H]MBC2851770.1 ATP-binding cassette domain-containing protein [Cetobacterium sp. 8H]
MSYLKIQNIEKRFGKFTALNDINFEIEKGEFICFLGPSGCGKTTLLRIIAGLETVDKGEIFLKNENITKIHPSKRNMSIVFQSYALFPNLTVGENIAYGMKNKKIPNHIIQKKVDESLELVGLRGNESKYPNELSGGQQQRVALARAIAYSPDILLLDEPLSALDAKVREKLRNDIKDLQKKLGITTIMVTHDQEEALSMSDRIVVMDNAKVVQVGTPQDIYERPSNNFIGDFIGKLNKFEINGNKISARPEDISLAGENCNDFFAGTLVSWEYMGSYYRLKVDKKGFLIEVDICRNKIKNISLKKDQNIFLKVERTLGGVGWS